MCPKALGSLPVSLPLASQGCDAETHLSTGILPFTLLVVFRWTQRGSGYGLTGVCLMTTLRIPDFMFQYIVGDVGSWPLGPQCVWFWIEDPLSCSEGLLIRRGVFFGEVGIITEAQPPLCWTPMNVVFYAGLQFKVGSKWGLGPEASASPENLLEVYILRS